MRRLSSELKLDKSSMYLVLISSGLLGIWATMHTIALRNLLLGFGCLFAIFYWVNWLKVAKKNIASTHFLITNFLPASIPLIFLWIIFHPIFFSVDFGRELSEFSGTWTRSALAVLTGSATGLALIRCRGLTPFLWIGLMTSFIVLMLQYIPKALYKNSLFAVDFYGDYIYWAKFNGVLAGAILIAALFGMLLDRYFFNAIEEPSIAKSCHENCLQKFGMELINRDVVILSFCTFGFCIVIYAFVFIFDSKAGVGIAIILALFWLIFFIFWAVKRILGDWRCIFKLKANLRHLFFLLFLSTIFVWFAYKHIKNNSGWEHLLSDIVISSQIDKYPNWRNLSKFNLPIREDGSEVRDNTYVRVSWAVVGLRLIKDNPWGTGLFRSFPDQVRGFAPEFSGSPYSHSGWIDLGLAYGIPFLFLVFSTFLVILMKVIKNRHNAYRGTVITFCVTLLILYGVGEYGFQHSVEILFFFLGLLSSLCLSNVRV